VVVQHAELDLLASAPRRRVDAVHAEPAAVMLRGRDRRQAEDLEA